MPDQITIKTPLSPPQPMTTAELMQALRHSYDHEADITQRRRGEASVPELLLEEVAAPGTNRRCDLLRIGMWPSRGHHIAVHELKVSRSDWLRELDDPAKAEAWWPYCHSFWIVAPDGLIRTDVLPGGWGLMVPPTDTRSRRFRIRKKAAVKEPKITPALLAEITKRADNRRLAQIADLNTRREEMINKAVREAVNARGVSPDLRRRLDLLERLEAALGVRLDAFGWSQDGELSSVTPDELATALRAYTADHIALQRLRQELELAATRLSRAAEHALTTAAEAHQRQPGVKRGDGRG